MLTIEATIRGKRRDSVVFHGTALNMSEVARRTGIDVSTVSRIFSKDRNPSLSQVLGLAALFDMSVEDFLRELGNRP